MLDLKQDNGMDTIDVLKRVFGEDTDLTQITLSQCRELFSVVWSILEMKAVQDLDKITELQNRDTALAEQPDAFAYPPYGLLPVPAVFYERIVELSERRGISVGVLMQKDVIHRHLMLLLDKELL